MTKTPPRKNTDKTIILSMLRALCRAPHLPVSAQYQNASPAGACLLFGESDGAGFADDADFDLAGVLKLRFDLLGKLVR